MFFQPRTRAFFEKSTRAKKFFLFCSRREAGQEICTRRGMSLPRRFSGRKRPETALNPFPRRGMVICGRGRKPASGISGLTRRHESGEPGAGRHSAGTRAWEPARGPAGVFGGKRLSAPVSEGGACPGLFSAYAFFVFSSVKRRRKLLRGAPAADIFVPDFRLCGVDHMFTKNWNPGYASPPCSQRSRPRSSSLSLTRMPTVFFSVRKIRKDEAKDTSPMTTAPSSCTRKL